jgi:hypothetical protein
MISEETLVFRWELTRILPKDVIVDNIKKNLFPFNFIALSVRTKVCVTKVSNNVRYVHKYLPQIDGYILESLSSSSPAFVTNILYPFHISFKPPFATQFSLHILSDVFDQSSHFSTVFQNRTFDLSCLSSHMILMYKCSLLKSLIRHLFQNVLTVAT